LRIAYVCLDPGISAEGTKGASVHVRDLIAAFESLGHDVTLFSPRSGSLLPAIAAKNQPEREKAQRALNGHLAKALDDCGPFDFVYERHSLFSHVGMEWANIRGVPGVVEVNSPLIDEQAEHRGLIARNAAQESAIRSFASATKIIAVSSGLSDYIREYADNPRVVVCPNGVSPERFPEHVVPSRPDSRFTVGFLGTLKPWHGIDILIDSFIGAQKIKPQIRLLVVGDGPMANAFAGSQGVETTGAVGPDDVPALLASMDVGIAPYPPRSDFYFSPLKIVEYMAAGLPVIASELGDIPMVVTDGVEGLLVEPGSESAISDAIVLLSTDYELARRMGMAGRKKVLAEFTWESIALTALDVAVPV